MIVWGGESNQLFVAPTRAEDTTLPLIVGQLPAPFNTPSARRSQTAVWTGTEMIIWGGHEIAITGTGGRYNPETNSWTNIGTNNAPSPRS